MDTNDLDSLNLNLPGDFRDRFVLLQKIGTGGTGTVYKVDDKTLQRLSALKVLNSDKRSAKAIQRLHKEAKTICQLKHPNIVDIYDFIVTEDERPVMVMEYVEGTPLDRIIEDDGPMNLNRSIAVFRQICAAMSYAHGRGVMHRDLAPNNILIRQNEKGEDQIKVVDFGIARIEDMEDKTIAGGGLLVGTPSVVSPEQARGQTTDARSDIYSLGCSMYRVLTGKFPYESENFIETVYKHLNDPVPTLAEGNPDIDYPPLLEQLIGKALQKVPADRFKNMKEVADALEEVADSGLSPIQFGSILSGVQTESQLKNDKRFYLKVLAVCLAVLLIPAGLIYALRLIDNADKEQAVDLETKFKTFSKNKQLWFEANALTPTVFTEFRFTDAVRFNLRRGKFTDHELSELVKSPLLAIDLRDTDISDDSLQVVAGCKTLRTVLLSGCKRITDNGLKHLSKLPNLNIVALSDTKIGDEGIREICKKDLYCLTFANCTNVTDKSLPFIDELEHLDTLWIGHSSISKNGAIHLLGKEHLGKISVPDYGLEDKDFDRMSLGYSRLELPGNQITPAVFKRIGQLPYLFFLDLERCPNISTAEMNRFCKEQDHKGRTVEVLPVSLVYGDNLDQEGYYEPYLYDYAKGDRAQVVQEKVKQLLVRWQTERLIQAGYDYGEIKTERYSKKWNINPK